MTVNKGYRIIKTARLNISSVILILTCRVKVFVVDKIRKIIIMETFFNFICMEVA